MAALRRTLSVSTPMPLSASSPRARISSRVMSPPCICRRRASTVFAPCSDRRAYMTSGRMKTGSSSGCRAVSPSVQMPLSYV